MPAQWQVKKNLTTVNLYNLFPKIVMQKYLRFAYWSIKNVSNPIKKSFNVTFF